MNSRAARPARGWRYWVRQLHLWTALALCVPLALLGVTGSVLVFEEELAALSSPTSPPAQAGAPQPIGRIIAAAAEAAPPGLRPTLYMPADEPGGLATVRFAPPGRTRPGPGGATMRIDPVTLRALPAETGDGGLLRTIFRLHANALLSPPAGRPIIGWLGAAMVALGVTGFVIWWPRSGRWRSAFLVRRGGSPLRLNRDLHGAIGIWTLPVFLIVGMTGLYLAFPGALGDAIGAVFPGRDLRAAARAVKVEPVPDQRPADVDSMVTLALAHAGGGGKLLAVGLPTRPTQPYRVMVAPQGRTDGAPALSLFADPWRAEIVEVHDPRGYTAGETIRAWQHPLHAGRGLGPVWRILVFISGLLPAFFLVTGITVWVLRRRPRRRTRALPLAST